LQSRDPHLYSAIPLHGAEQMHAARHDARAIVGDSRHHRRRKDGRLATVGPAANQL